VKAARRAIETLLPFDMEIKVLVLPEGKDPDDFIRENGHETYNEVRGKAFPYLQFVLDSSIRGRNLSMAKQKADAIEEVLPVLSAVRNPIQKQESFDQAMRFFRVEDAGFRRDLWKSVGSGGNIEPETVRQRLVRTTAAKITVAEQRLLELLVYDRELRAIILPQLEDTDHEELATASVFKAIIDLHKGSEQITLEDLLDAVEDDEIAQDFVPLMMMAEYRRANGEAIDDVLHEAENCVFTLRSMAITNHIVQISQDLIAAEQAGDQDKINGLVADQIELAKMNRTLLRKIRET
jgi:DNA primase